MELIQYCNVMLLC